MGTGMPNASTTPGETMAKENTDRSDEITDPDNPPRVLLRPKARRAALWSYLGPVIALFVIVGVALVYWVNRGPAADAPADRGAIGTVGRDSAGGGDPQPAFDSTVDELKHRGVATADDNTIRSIAGARAADRPQPVMLERVTVDKTEGQVTWVKNAGDQIAVVGTGTPQLRTGDVVSVSGTTERDASGAVVIRGDIHKN
jgi:hypothetical protein